MLQVEQLESRECPAAYFSVAQGAKAYWANPADWRIGAVDGPTATVSPSNFDDVFVFGSKELILNLSTVTVNSLHILPPDNIFNLRIGGNTLRVRDTESNPSGNFEFHAGTIQFDSPFGHLVLENIIGGSWRNSASFIGGGTVELQGSTLDVSSNGIKGAETTIYIGPKVGEGLTPAFIVQQEAKGSLDLGLSGKIYNDGNLLFNNKFEFTINSTEENPYSLVNNKNINKISNGNININVGILNTGSILISDGAFIVNDPNNNASITQIGENASTELKDATALVVHDGYWQYGGAFRLLGTGLKETRDIVTTFGDFYFSDGIVSFVHDLAHDKGIIWQTDEGEVIFGSEIVTYVNISGDTDKRDRIYAEYITLGGELFVNEVVDVAPNTDIILISAEMIYGDWSEKYWNGVALSSGYDTDIIFSDGYHYKLHRHAGEGGGEEEEL